MGHAHASCVGCGVGPGWRIRGILIPIAFGPWFGRTDYRAPPVGTGPRPGAARRRRARPTECSRPRAARARVPRSACYGPIDGQQLYKHSRIPRDWAERWTSRDDSDQPGQATPITIRLSAARVDLSCTECRGSERRPRAALVHERPATPLRTPSSRFCRKQDAAQDRSRPNRLRR